MLERLQISVKYRKPHLSLQDLLDGIANLGGRKDFAVWAILCKVASLVLFCVGRVLSTFKSQYKKTLTLDRIRN